MRNDWIPLSASALVIGAMSLVFGSILNPSPAGATARQTLAVVDENSFRWVAMSVMFVLGSFMLTAGLPAVLTLFERRGRTLGMISVAVFAVGTIGTCGYAMLMVFFRAMVVAGAVRGPALNSLTNDKGLKIFLSGWIFGFYGGVLLLAIAFLVARTVPRWVPVVLLAFVVLLHFGSHLGRVGSALQVMALAVAFTGIAMAAVTGEHQRRPTAAAAF
jgi:hypothetical protein